MEPKVVLNGKPDFKNRGCSKCESWESDSKLFNTLLKKTTGEEHIQCKKCTQKKLSDCRTS